MRIHKAPFVALFAAVVMAFMIPTQAQAQDTSQAPPPPPPMQQETDQVTFGNLIAALNNLNANIQDVEALNDLSVEDVRVVNVDDLLQGANVNALNNALNKNETDITALQDFLNQNQVLNDALNQNNVAVEDVVAVDVLSGGEVVIFVQNSEDM